MNKDRKAATWPAYLGLARAGQLHERVEKALALLAHCRVCPHVCGVNRLRDERGICRSGRWAMVSSASPHFGEEPPLVGRHGSGTIFFSQCNLSCLFCQNYEISQYDIGTPVGDETLARLMLGLQSMGCHNINLVSPSHVVPQILAALDLAVEGGLHIPLVYNSGGYDALPTLRLLDGVVDIYMPDMKYSSPTIAQRLSAVKEYPKVNRIAVREMYRQVGDLTIDDRGVAVRGLLVRHLILPDQLAGTADIVRYLAERVSKNTYVNLMDQYRPCFRAMEVGQLSRRVSQEEYDESIRLARHAGLHRGFG